MRSSHSCKKNHNAPNSWIFQKELDTKELGCGDMVMALYKYFKPLDSGTIVKVRALDAGDVMAWCRNTGNTMHDSIPPFFLIEKN